MLSALSGCGTVSDTLEDFAYTVGSFTEDAIDDLAARLRYRDEDDRNVINVVEEELQQTVITINDEDFVSAGNSAKLSGNALRGLRLNELSSIVDNYAYAMISDEERLIYDEVYDLLLLPPFTCHSLRHTYATRLCESGINITALQDLLGHKDIDTTMEVYAEATKDLKKKEISKIELDKDIWAV